MTTRSNSSREASSSASTWAVAPTKMQLQRSPTIRRGFFTRLFSFTESDMFLRSVRATFDEIDVDKSGTIDETELYIGVLLIYNRLNALLPTHNNPPSRNDVIEMMSQFDSNNNRKLDRKEFTTLAKALMDPSKDPKYTERQKTKTGKGSPSGDRRKSLSSTTHRASGILPGIVMKLIMTTVILPLVAYVIKECCMMMLDSSPLKEYVKVRNSIDSNYATM